MSIPSREPFVITLNGFLDSPARPLTGTQTKHLTLSVHRNLIHISGLSVDLHGETDGRHSVILKGAASADQLPTWQPALTDLVRNAFPGDHQLDIYEEDGRLVKRLQFSSES